MERKTPQKRNLNVELAARRESIANAMRTFAKEQGIDPDYLGFHFSSNIAEYDGSAASYEHLKKNGFCVEARTSQSIKKIPDYDAFCTGPAKVMKAFNGEQPLTGFKTFATFRNCISASTWEDVALGMNEQFERLGSLARVDTSLFKSR